jgi:hypothetical protein
LQEVEAEAAALRSRLNGGEGALQEVRVMSCVCVSASTSLSPLLILTPPYSPSLPLILRQVRMENTKLREGIKQLRAADCKEVAALHSTCVCVCVCVWRCSFPPPLRLAYTNPFSPRRRHRRRRYCATERCEDREAAAGERGCPPGGQGGEGGPRAGREAGHGQHECQSAQQWERIIYICTCGHGQNGQSRRYTCGMGGGR